MPLLSNFQRDIDSLILRIESPRPLNYIEYNRDRALQELNDYCGFEYYGSKHLENRLTKFIQLYWFPKKYNVDKRTSHLSSMIVSGQMTREKALKLLEEPLYDEEEMEKDIGFILNSLDLSREEFNRIMSEPSKQHTDYRTSIYNSIRRKIVPILRTAIKQK